MESNIEEIQTPSRVSKVEPLECASFVAGGASCIGDRSENQDSFLLVSKDSLLCMSVCDGMGGTNGGGTASGIAVMEINRLLDLVKEENIDENTLVKIVESANAEVYERAASDPSVRGMGTTVTLAIITAKAAFVAHVGDSRIYCLRNGKKAFRTFDHSKVFEMVAAGIISEEEARCSNFSNIITGALGIRPKVDVTVSKIPYRKGDRFILCSDGIWNCLPEPEVIRMFEKKKRPEEEVEFLIETVDVLGFEKGGGHDNMTVVVADMKRDSDFQYTWGDRIGKIMKKWGRGKEKEKK